MPFEVGRSLNGNVLYNFQSGNSSGFFSFSLKLHCLSSSWGCLGIALAYICLYNLFIMQTWMEFFPASEMTAELVWMSSTLIKSTFLSTTSPTCFPIQSLLKECPTVEPIDCFSLNCLRNKRSIRTKKFWMVSSITPISINFWTYSKQKVGNQYFISP